MSSFEALKDLSWIYTIWYKFKQWSVPNFDWNFLIFPFRIIILVHVFYVKAQRISAP